jgi:hypothetical protein
MADCFDGLMVFNQSYDGLLKIVARHKNFTVGGYCLNLNFLNYRITRILFIL